MRMVERELSSGVKFPTYISNDGIAWGDEESCLEHEANYSQYKDVANKAKISVSLKSFNEGMSDEFFVDCIEIEGGLDVKKVKWFKVKDSNEAKEVLKAHLEYFEESMKWAENLDYPDYIAVVQGENGGLSYSYRQLLSTSRQYIEKYKEYLDYFESQFEKL